jgi:isoquinoline 1-oxidoreductase alpha subunit
VNGKSIDLKVDGDTPSFGPCAQAGLTGTKYARDRPMRACSVHINGEVQRSCSILIKDVKPGDKIVTIEGLCATATIPCKGVAGARRAAMHRQAGQIMAATRRCSRKSPSPRTPTSMRR